MAELATFDAEFVDAWRGQARAFELSEHQRHFLDVLRRVGRQCRAKPRTDLFEACASLSGDTSIAQMTFVEALIRCLSQALGTLPVLYSPGERSVSFDEAWLLQLADVIVRNDDVSMEFLLRSRVRPHARRQIESVMVSIVERSRSN